MKITYRLVRLKELYKVHVCYLDVFYFYFYFHLANRRGANGRGVEETSHGGGGGTKTKGRRGGKSEAGSKEARC